MAIVGPCAWKKKKKYLYLRTESLRTTTKYVPTLELWASIDLTLLSSLSSSLCCLLYLSTSAGFVWTPCILWRKLPSAFSSISWNESDQSSGPGQVHWDDLELFDKSVVITLNFFLHRFTRLEISVYLFRSNLGSPFWGISGDWFNWLEIRYSNVSIEHCFRWAHISPFCIQGI